MNRKRIVLAAGTAFTLALLASLVAYKYLTEKTHAAEQAKLQTVGIIAAVVDIPMGSTINPNQVAATPWPEGNLPFDSFRDPNAVVGRMTRREFLKGEPIVESKLLPKDKNSGILAMKVPPGMRAFSVKVNEVVGVGGFIVPDSRVDVVTTTAVSPNRQQHQFSKVVLQNVLVLAAGQSVEQKDNKPVTVNTVTLAVTPEEAEKLALASNDGKVQLVLRNFSDPEKVETTGIDKRRLLSSYRKPVPARTRPGRKTEYVTAYKVEVYRGAKRTEEQVD